MEVGIHLSQERRMLQYQLKHKVVLLLLLDLVMVTPLVVQGFSLHYSLDVDLIIN